MISLGNCNWIGDVCGVPRAVRGAEESRFLAALGMTRIILAWLLGEEVVEGADGGEFVVFDVEDGVELGDVEDVVNFLGEVEEFEFATGVADGGEAADEFSDAGAVDVVDADEVEDDLLFALGDQGADGVAEIADFVAEDDATSNVEDGDVSDFAGFDLQGHDSGSSLRPMAGMVVGAERQVNGLETQGPSTAPSQRSGSGRDDKWLGMGAVGVGV